MERKCQSHPLNHKKRTSSHLIWLNHYFRGVDGPRKAKQSTGLFLCRSFFAFGSNSLPCYPNLTPLNHKKRTSYDVLFWWKGVDSDHRSDNATDLQSAPFGRSGTLPYIKLFGGPSGTRTPDQPVMSR